MKKYVRRVLALFMIVAVLALQIDVPEAKAAEHAVNGMMLSSGVFEIEDKTDSRIVNPIETLDIGDVYYNESTFKFADFLMSEFEFGEGIIPSWTTPSGISVSQTPQGARPPALYYEWYFNPADASYNAGNNTVELSVQHGEQKYTLNIKFNLIKEDNNLAITSASDIVYGQIPEIPYSLVDDTAVVKFSFDGGEFEASKEKLLDVGAHNVKVMAEETASHISVTSGAVGFNVTPCTPSFSISGTNPGETITSAVSYAELGVEKTLTQGTDYTLQYKVKGADDSTYTTTRPTAAGEYTARAFMGASYASNLNNPTKDFTIERIDGTVSFSIADFNYGGSLASATTITTTSYDAASAKIYYKKATDAAYSSTFLPEEAGVYNAYITFPQNDNYNAYTSVASPVTFEIKKVMPTLTLSGTGLNETLTSSVVHIATGLEVGGTSGKYILKFKKKGEPDSAYTTVKPTEAGEYVAIAEFVAPLSNNYENPTLSFSTERLEGTANFSIADISYGETLIPVIRTEDYKLSTAKITYKFVGTDDKTYTDVMPEVPGKYMAKLYFPENAKYLSFETTCTFEIKKAEGEGEVSIADYYIGMTPAPEVASEKNGIKKVVIEYKPEGAPDTAYSKAIPASVGTFVVRATFPEDAYYLKAYAEEKFIVSYMPSPGYITTGKKGENDFYISDVVLKAPNGYQIGTEFNGVYSDELLYSDVSEQKSLYFKDVKTGAMSDGEKMPSYKVDIAAPHFNEDIEDNKVVYNETQEYTINDPNLATVLVNGKKIDISDGKASLALSARGGRMVYRIEAIDQAGNSITYTIVVAEEWTESGIIPENHDVRLDAGTNYTLEAGRWTIQGDSTVYMGGTVYVREETSTRITKN